MRRHWLLALLSSLAWVLLIAFYSPPVRAQALGYGPPGGPFSYTSEDAYCKSFSAPVAGSQGATYESIVYWSRLYITGPSGSGTCFAVYYRDGYGENGADWGWPIASGPLECPAGQTLVNGACVVSCTAGQTISSGYMDVGSSITARSSSSLYCSAGCEFTYSGPGTLDVRIVGGVKRYFAPALYTGNGQACDTVPAPPPPAASSALPPNTCASGQYGGTVNGTWRCFDRTTGEETVKADDDTGVKKDETTTTNPDGTVTTRTTETTRNADGTTSTTTTTRTCDSSGNCSSTTSGGSGSGSSGGSGGGGSGEPECVAGTAGCATLGGVAAETLPNVTRALSITRDSGWEHSSTCPADKVLNLAAVTLVVPFTMLCDVADMARPIVIGVAWVIAVSGFFGLASKR